MKNIELQAVPFEGVLPMRDLYFDEVRCQLIHASAPHREGGSQTYLVRMDGHVAGYVLFWVGSFWMARQSLYEFYVTPVHRPFSFEIFQHVLRRLRPERLYLQTNDSLMLPVFHAHAKDPVTEKIMFADRVTTRHAAPNGVIFRRKEDADGGRIFKHGMEPEGDWVLEESGRVIATGGILYHYNRPYGDIYMEVAKPHRRRGFGAYLVQELKRVCYEGGSVPGARCNIENTASHRTLAAAGFVPCASVLHGTPVKSSARKSR